MKGIIAAAVGVLALGAVAVAIVALQGSAPDVRVEPRPSRAAEASPAPAPQASAAPLAPPPAAPQPAAPASAAPPAPVTPVPVAHDPADRRLESGDEAERQDGMTAVRDQRRGKLIDWMNRRRERRSAAGADAPSHP